MIKERMKTMDGRRNENDDCSKNETKKKNDENKTERMNENDRWKKWKKDAKRMKEGMRNDDRKEDEKSCLQKEWNMMKK